MTAKQATPRNYFLIVSLLILVSLCIIILALGVIVGRKVMTRARVNNPSTAAGTPALVQDIQSNKTLAASQTAQFSQTPTILPTSNPTQTPSLTLTQTPTISLTPTPGAGATRLRPSDGMLMVHVPESKFTMGSSKGIANERPAHTVALDDYWIDQTEVTNAMFRFFVEATGYTTDAEKVSHSLAYQAGATIPVAQKWKQVPGADWLHPHGPGSSIDGLESHPVVQMSWNDATAYCKWAGARLPTEAEWERAARSIDERTYPWGNQVPGGTQANSADVNLDAIWANKGINDGYKFTSPVGHYPAGKSPLGLLDMAGNAAEWVFDLYKSDFYYSSPVSNPTGAESGYVHVTRGGQWSFTADGLRSAARIGQLQTFSSDYSGFRCAMTPEG